MEQYINHSAQSANLSSELEQRVRNNLKVMLKLVKLQSPYPPTSAAQALARAAGQIVTLAAIYDDSIELYGLGMVELDRWCRRFIDSMAQGLANIQGIGFSCTGRGPTIGLDRAQAIGLALGELLADASERARFCGRLPKIEVTLDSRDYRVSLRVVDESPSERVPELAQLLAKEFEAEIWDLGGTDRSERELVFSSLTA